MEKSPEAFRTISEVAEFLETPAHVLRFWESRFPQIRPVKRAGGRRYYRPADVALLSGIKRLLHDEGMTIRGVQKILREQGIRYVAALSPAGDMPPEDDVEAVLAAEFGPDGADASGEAEVVQTAQIISLERALARQEAGQEAAPAVWPEDVGDEPAAQQEHWPHDPEDVTEAPFAEVEGDESDQGGAGIDPPATGADVAGTGEAADTITLSAESSGDDRPDEPEVPDSEDSTLASRLRRLSPYQVAHRRAELRALYQRLYDLRERLAQAARRRAR